MFSIILAINIIPSISRRLNLVSQLEKKDVTGIVVIIIYKYSNFQLYIQVYYICIYKYICIFVYNICIYIQIIYTNILLLYTNIPIPLPSWHQVELCSLDHLWLGGTTWLVLANGLWPEAIASFSRLECFLKHCRCRTHQSSAMPRWAICHIIAVPSISVPNWEQWRDEAKSMPTCNGYTVRAKKYFFILLSQYSLGDKTAQPWTHASSSTWPSRPYHQPHYRSITVTFCYPFVCFSISQHSLRHQKFANNVEYRRGKKMGVSSPWKSWFFMPMCSSLSIPGECIALSYPKLVSPFPPKAPGPFSCPFKARGRNPCWSLLRTFAMFCLQACSQEECQFFLISEI